MKKRSQSKLICAQEGVATPTPQTVEDLLGQYNAEVGTEQTVLPEGGSAPLPISLSKEELNPYPEIAASYMGSNPPTTISGLNFWMGSAAPLITLQKLEDELAAGDISGLFDPTYHPLVRLQALERLRGAGKIDETLYGNLRLGLQDEWDMLKEMDTGGGSSDALGWAQLAQSERLHREDVATQLLVEKMQEESVNRTGERNTAIDLLGDMMSRTTAQRLAAKDYVDTLMNVAEKAPMPGQEYYAGAEPGGARDILRQIAGIGAEFPREIGTAEIPVGMLQPNVPTTEEELTRGRDIARQMFSEQGIGPGGEMASYPTLADIQAAAGTAKSGKIVRAAQGSIAVSPFGEYSPEQLSLLAQLQTSGLAGTIGTTGLPDTGTVVSGEEQDTLAFLRDQIAAETALQNRQMGIDEAIARGYFPGGAPTASMQQAELDYKRALEVANIQAGSARAQAAAEKASARLYAEAQKYAADQGLKGDEVSAAATRYVADVGARTAAERLGFEKAQAQATLGANPRTVFESLFLNRAMQPTSNVTALQKTIPTSVMAEGGQVVEGPTLLLTGERNPKDKEWDTAEYVFAPPGTIVGKKRKGEKPTMKNAMRAIFSQVSEAQAGASVSGGGDVWRKYFLNAAKRPVQMQGGGEIGAGAVNITPAERARRAMSLKPYLEGMTPAEKARFLMDNKAYINGQVNAPALPSTSPTTIASPETGGALAVDLVAQARNSPLLQGRIQDALRAQAQGGQRNVGLSGSAYNYLQQIQNMPQWQSREDWQAANPDAAPEEWRREMMKQALWRPRSTFAVRPEYANRIRSPLGGQVNLPTQETVGMAFGGLVGSRTPVAFHNVSTATKTTRKPTKGYNRQAQSEPPAEPEIPSWLTDPTVDIPADVLTPDLLNAPAFGGTPVSTLYRPSPIRGAFGMSKEALGERFNPLASDYFRLSRLSGTEQQALAGLLSMLGIEPEDYFEASRRSTKATFGSPLASQSPLVASRFAGSLL